MPDLLEEAKRLSEAVSVAEFSADYRDVIRIDRLAALIPELVERVEQAERRAELLREMHRMRDRFGPHFMTTEVAREESLAAQQREDER